MLMNTPGDVLGRFSRPDRDRDDEVVRAKEGGFDVKLRLDTSQSRPVAIVTTPDLTKDFPFDTLTATDKEAKLSDLSINWKSTQADKTKGRDFKSRKCQVDTNCYFMVTKHEDENTLLVTPISHYFVLEPFIPLKSHPDTFDNPAEDKIGERLMKLAKSDDATQSSTSDAKKDGSGGRKRLLASGSVGWDYDGDVPSDDEEMYPQVKTEVAEDPFGYQNLSIYGHRLKSLLVQQEEREADDELEQYSDGDDAGSQVSAGSKTKSQEKAKSPAKKAKVEEKPSAFEEKIMRFMKQNMGRVTVKEILGHFNIKEKNDDFRAIQEFIKKKCTMVQEEKDGKQIKVITLKSEFRG